MTSRVSWDDQRPNHIVVTGSLRTHVKSLCYWYMVHMLASIAESSTKYLKLLAENLEMLYCSSTFGTACTIGQLRRWHFVSSGCSCIKPQTQFAHQKPLYQVASVLIIVIKVILESVSVSLEVLLASRVCSAQGYWTSSVHSSLSYILGDGALWVKCRTTQRYTCVSWNATTARLLFSRFLFARSVDIMVHRIQLAWPHFVPMIFSLLGEFIGPLASPKIDCEPKFV